MEAQTLVNALKQVQLALANWRDGQDETYFLGLGRLNLEEVKYVIVDKAIEEYEKGL